MLGRVWGPETRLKGRGPELRFVILQDLSSLMSPRCLLLSLQAQILFLVLGGVPFLGVLPLR